MILASDDLILVIHPEHDDRDRFIDDAEPGQAPIEAERSRADGFDLLLERHGEGVCAPGRQGAGEPELTVHSSKKASVSGANIIFGMRALQLG